MLTFELFRPQIRPFAPVLWHFLALNAAKLPLERMIFKAKCYCVVNSSGLGTLAR
jgi:hypothetical protein